MLRNMKDMAGMGLRARDGDIGEIIDFYFDERDWAEERTSVL